MLRGPRTRTDVARGEPVVDVPRPAAALGVAQDPEAVGAGVVDVAAQRVLPVRRPAAEDEVDVGAGRPGGQRGAVDRARRVSATTPSAT